MADQSATSGTRPPARPNPVGAGLLSLAWPGIGQLYNGSWRRALLFVVGVPLLGVTGLILAVRVRVEVINLVPMLLGVGAQIVAVVDAARGGGIRSGNRYWYNRAPLCIALVLGWLLLLAPIATGAIRSLVQAFSIPTGGMEPALLIGDHLLVDKLAYGVRNPWSGERLYGRDPRRGDIIAFRFPEDRSRTFMKRVIGLPGETVEIKSRDVFVDGRRLEEPYAQFMAQADAVPSGFRHWGPTRVPADHLFVLGDNRDNSRDSRFWGFVPISDVLGEARVVYYSVEPIRNRIPSATVPTVLRLPTVRWRRLGKLVR